MNLCVNSMEFSGKMNMNGSISQLSAQGATLLSNLKSLNNGAVPQGLDFTNTGLNALGAASGFQSATAAAAAAATAQLNQNLNLGIPANTDPNLVEGFKQWLTSNIPGAMPLQSMPNCLPGATQQLLNNPLINPGLPMKLSDPSVSALLLAAQGAAQSIQNSLPKGVATNALSVTNGLSSTNLEGRKAQKPRNKATKRSRYRGVYWNKGSRSWRSLISINGKTQHLGNFNSQEEAAQEFDRKARELKRTKLNFPDQEVKPAKVMKVEVTAPVEVAKPPNSPEREDPDPEQEPGPGPELEQGSAEDEMNPRCKSKLQCPSSKYRGVYYVKQRNEWRARIWNDGKSEHLGNFETEEEAAKEFDRRSKELGRDNLNFPESKV